MSTDFRTIMSNFVATDIYTLFNIHVEKSTTWFGIRRLIPKDDCDDYDNDGDETDCDDFDDDCDETDCDDFKKDCDEDECDDFDDDSYHSERVASSV